MIVLKNTLFCSFILLITFFSNKGQSSATKSDCHAVLEHFMKSDFENWEALPPCSLDEIISFFPTWDQMPFRGYYSGRKNRPQQVKTFVGTENELRTEVWYQKDTTVFTKIVLEFPQVEDPKALLKSFGVPDLKLDYYLDVLLYEEQEWVYLDKGLALRISDDYEILWEIILFAPTTEEHYIDEIYYSEEMHEHPYQKD